MRIACLPSTFVFFIQFIHVKQVIKATVLSLFFRSCVCKFSDRSESPLCPCVTQPHNFFDVYLVPVAHNRYSFLTKISSTTERGTTSSLDIPSVSVCVHSVNALVGHGSAESKYSGKRMKFSNLNSKKLRTYESERTKCRN